MTFHTGLEVQGLACQRGGRPVLRDLTFTLEPGEALLVTGPNGAGKSTLLRALAGLLTIEAGRVVVTQTGHGELEAGAQAEACHLLGPLDPIKPSLTVRENLAGHAALLGATGDQVDAALAAFELGALAQRFGRALSSGQRRRLSLARLVAAPRPVWLLDEPTNGLDVAAQARLESVIADHRAQGGLVVAASHQPLAMAKARSLILVGP